MSTPNCATKLPGYSPWRMRVRTPTARSSMSHWRRSPTWTGSMWCWGKWRREWSTLRTGHPHHGELGGSSSGQVDRTVVIEECMEKGKKGRGKGLALGPAELERVADEDKMLRLSKASS
ncbi:hypothetical protein Vretimale_10443 [Volvox reticuliferus]|uniref:Uncharacterized protein n=1 Tax=Volvox reticuliferus TaxID=1737510 RepID=A0A8J4LR99_9CHLO|nr:hypothetical protein Vretifemale_12397 [Volvox reticuliferus]GIM06027.1 hypothetical protein Vretimale_10443 [Volvox reticuliferus]